MFCIYCGANLPEYAGFCSKCGTRLSDPQGDEPAGNQKNKTGVATGGPSFASRVLNLFKRQPDGELAGEQRPRGSYKWALVYGWFMIATAAYLVVVAALKLLGVQDSTPSATPFAHSQSIGTASAMFQGLLWLATGLAILQRRLIAIRLMWAVVILAGLGVLVRGIVPLDLLIWILSVLIAKWFSTKREFLSQRGRRGVERPKETSAEGQRDHWWARLEPNAAKTPGQAVSTVSSRQGTTRAIASTPKSHGTPKYTKRKIAIALLVLAIATLGLAVSLTVIRKHSDSGPQLQKQNVSVVQPKIDYVAAAKEMGGVPVTSSPSTQDEGIDLSDGLVPKHMTDSDLKDLQETLQWLKGASENESATGITPYQHYTFDSTGENGCSVAITETRVAAGPDFWLKESFSLADIDPADIQVIKLGKGAPTLSGESAVVFHTTNYRDAIVHTSNRSSTEILTSDHTITTNNLFAPRFAKALKHAAALCGAKPSKF